MIKIQPSHSRVTKSESPDRLTLTYPARGLLSAGGLLLLIALIWIGVMVLVMLEIGWKVAQIGAGFLLFPASIMGLCGAAMCVHRWSFERTPTTVFFRRGGLLGTRTREWPADDVTSFWVYVRDPGQGGSELIIGFRNGRSETLLIGYLEEDFRWVAAMMKDPRGDRPAPTTTRAAAEPVARRSDPSVEPAGVAVRKVAGGVKLTFLPLLDFKGRWWKLLALAVLGMSEIVILSEILDRVVESYPPWIARVAAGLWLLIIVGRLVVLRRSTVIQVQEGIVTIVQNQNREHWQFPVDQVEFVQTFRASENNELQFLLRDKPKVRVLRDRPADELEWAARFLRVAIKGRAPEEAAAMTMEAAAGQCQVCGEKMESRVIFCGKCRTPHHEECWSYVGQCSTFGCREIRFTRT